MAGAGRPDGRAATDRTSPVQIGSATTWTTIGKSTGGSTCVARSDASVWCWGLSGQGRFGTGSLAYFNGTPAQVRSSTTAFAVGWSHLCLVGTDTRLRCTGSNEHLQGGWEASITAPAQVGSATSWGS